MRILFPIVMILFCFGCAEDSRQPGYEIKMLSDMKESVAHEAFTPNSEFQNGATLQTPVEGTIPRSNVSIQTDKNPVPFSAQALNRGKFVYENYCLVCHGATGDGDGPLIPKYPNPPAFTSRKVKNMTDVDLYKVIVEGKDDMPSHAGQITLEDRWKLIFYLEKLQGKRP